MQRKTIEAAIVRFRNAKRSKEVAEQEYSDSQSVLIVQMGSSKSAKATTEVEAITATKVQSSSVKIDDARLKKELGATVFNKLCSMSLDKAKLEDAIARGLVDANIVAMCSEEIERAPYIRLTVKEIASTKRDVTPSSVKPKRVARPIKAVQAS